MKVLDSKFERLALISSQYGTVILGAGPVLYGTVILGAATCSLGYCPNCSYVFLSVFQVVDILIEFSF